ncbi:MULTISPECIES: hypothetical protein [Bacillus]|uniref:hypothetical protein n=1 Tax=Bacillus TaxID=1386 RepID=UPI000F76F8DD|nr:MULTISPECIES: hypothetical protein [Bacillus]MDJ0286829.1 hypothetical protein [Bacillus altitudinis]
MKVENSIYIFNGYKFLDFIDTEKFKEDVLSEFEIPEKVQKLDFPDYYSHLMVNFPGEQKITGKIFFENILYSHLKNVFVEKISAHPNLNIEKFKEKLKQLIENVNFKESIPTNFHDLMSENGFYLMDLLNITVPNTSFIAGCDLTEINGEVSNARFLFVEAVQKSTQGTVYFIAGIEIDFKKNLALTMIKNVGGLTKENTEADTTIHQLHQKAINKVLHTLGISLKKPQVKNDREGMFKLCKKMDDNLLDDLRRELYSRVDYTVKESVKNLNHVLFNDTVKLSNTDQSDLRKKIKALLLSYYIEYQIKPLELVRKAKRNKLIGYPTRINFTSNKSSRSSTQSSNSKYPVSASDMFHSLYFNFEQALGLDSWSVSWFTDYIFSDEKDIDVIQTTIYSTTKQFRIVFLATRPLNKEIIHYVINTIDSHR